MGAGRRGSGRRTTVVVLVVATTVAMMVAASPAGASTVSAVTVVVSSPSPAAGALTTYKVGLKTSSTGGLVGSSGGKITIVLPAGTGFTAFSGSSPIAVGTTQVGQCSHTTGTTVVCSIYTGSTVAASTTVAMTLNGVTNPATPNSYTATVSTTADTTPVTSPTYTIATAKSVSAVTVVVSSPSAAAGALTTYKIGLTTSSTGGLAGSSFSKVSIVLPAGTGFAAYAGSSPIAVGATQVGQCSNVVGTTVTCFIYNGSTVAASTTLAITLNGVTNPTSPSTTNTFQISSTSDTTTKTSPTYTITAAKSVSAVTVVVSSPSRAAGALTTYKIGLKTSSTGGLAGSSGSKVSIVLPAGTGFTAYAGSSPIAVGATQVGQCSNVVGTTVTCFIYNGSTVAPSTTLAITLNGVTNPTSPSTTNTFQISSTSDTVPVTSPTYTITAAKSVSAVTVVVSSPSAAAGALTTYTIGLKTSSTGGLAGSSGSKVSIVLPAGTGFTAYAGSSPIKVGTTQVGQCSNVVGTTVTCFIYTGSTVAASTTLAITLNGVTNPTSPSTTNTFQISSTSDTTPKTSPTYTITAAKSVSSASVVISNSLPSASGVTYNLKVKTSSTGGLAGSSGSKLTIVLPAGTDLASLSGTSPVMVGTTQVGQCSHPTGTTVSCGIYTGSTVAASTTVAITLNGITNPAAPNVYTATVSTTSDTTVKNSSGYCVVAAGIPCIATVAPATGGVGTAVTITGANLAGATALKFHGTTASILTDTATKITTTVPSGATTGTITVTTGGGTATSPANFKVVPAPTISGFSPPSGPVGTLVTISGSNLANATSVKFNGTSATIATNTAGQITANVPSGATSGKITVTTAGGIATSATNFTVT